MSMTSALDGQGLAASYPVTAAAVPEPASWALMGLGVAGLLDWRRRQSVRA